MLLPPVDDALKILADTSDETLLEQARVRHIVGSPERVRHQLDEIVRDSAADELLVVTTVHDPALRLRSYRLLAEAWPEAVDPLS